MVDVLTKSDVMASRRIKLCKDSPISQLCANSGVATFCAQLADGAVLKSGMWRLADRCGAETVISDF